MSNSQSAAAPAVEERERVDAKAITGPAAAFTLAAGIGVFAMGVVTTLSEVSTSVADDLTWDDGVGPLSGKSIVAALVFFASLIACSGAWRRSNPPLRPVLIGAGILIALGIVGTFPTFFQAFA
jgi:hypothetical protein